MKKIQIVVEYQEEEEIEQKRIGKEEIKEIEEEIEEEEIEEEQIKQEEIEEEEIEEEEIEEKEEEQAEHFTTLRENDQNHDVYVGQVGLWMPFHPEAYKTGKVEYLEKELNELMQSHMHNQELARKEMDKRKSTSIKV